MVDATSSQFRDVAAAQMALGVLARRTPEAGSRPVRLVVAPDLWGVWAQRARGDASPPSPLALFLPRIVDGGSRSSSVSAPHLFGTDGFLEHSAEDRVAVDAQPPRLSPRGARPVPRHRSVCVA